MIFRPAPPVIEEGTYDDFKACIFRVLETWVWANNLYEMQFECRQKGIYLAYMSADFLNCVELRIEVGMTRLLPGDVRVFLSDLAEKYGFVYTSVSWDQKDRESEYVMERGFHIEIVAQIQWRETLPNSFTCFQGAHAGRNIITHLQCPVGSSLDDL